jgi:hypothetical protein
MAASGAPLGMILDFLRAGLLMKLWQPENSAQDSPCKRYVRNEKSGTTLSYVPKRPLGAKGMGEGIVLVEDGGQNDEYSEAEDT